MIYCGVEIWKLTKMMIKKRIATLHLCYNIRYLQNYKNDNKFIHNHRHVCVHNIITSCYHIILYYYYYSELITDNNI